MNSFQKEAKTRINSYSDNAELAKTANDFMLSSINSQYSYNFSWLSRPIIQYPQDMVAMQELIWQVKPDLIIETGIAHGGSLIFSASLVALMELAEATASGTMLDPSKPKRKVLGVDIDIREHNKKAIEEHPLSNRINMIQGSSIDNDIIKQVHEYASNFQNILVCLDSNHTHDHVLAELEAYAPLTSKGSYCVVFDTLIEDMPKNTYPDRQWDVGNNPKTAVHKYLHDIKNTPKLGKDGNSLQFEIDKTIQNKLLITVAPDGYLKRIS